jgi:nicotinamidase-related amidase
MTPLKNRESNYRTFQIVLETELLDFEGNDISKLVICGMMTDVCISTTTSS